jgi:hypothetical protein
VPADHDVNDFHVNHYYAIGLGAGVISPVHPLENPRQNEPPLFHWSSGRTTGVYNKVYEKTARIRVGAFVTENGACTIDEERCWNSSAPAFEVLGVQDTTWRHDETQYGGQVGQYALLQYNRTRHKIPGTTLKDLVLRNVRNEAYLVRHSLDDLWGVQVSFCTGVARRIPLRVLMADLMPVVVKTMPNCRNRWNDLIKEHCVVDAFRSETVLEWLENLSSEQNAFMNQIMREVLLALEPTGVDEDRNELTVAWLNERLPYQCFRIPCSDKRNSWMKVLSDSGDCATFAYVVTHCLETSTVKCCGPSPHWRSTAPLLETAVLRHNLQPSQPLGPLEHNRMYFFKKTDCLLQVTVERRAINGPVSLYISPSSIPSKFRQRFYNLERMRNQVSRIRERREIGEIGAEAVSICTKAETKF